MFRRKKQSRSWRHKLLTGTDTALDWVAPKLGRAADGAESAYLKTSPKFQDASARVRSAMSNQSRRRAVLLFATVAIGVAAATFARRTSRRCSCATTEGADTASVTPTVLPVSAENTDQAQGTKPGPPSQGDQNDDGMPRTFQSET